MKNVRKILAFFLVLTMVFTLFPMGSLMAFAEGGAATPTDLNPSGDGENDGDGDSNPTMYTITWVIKEQAEKDGPLSETTIQRQYADGASLDGEFPSVKKLFLTTDKAYSFDSWSPAPHAVNGDETYTAVYTSEARLYLITWYHKVQNDDGTVEDAETSIELPYGNSAADYNLGKISPLMSEDTIYTLDHWSPALGTVVGEQVYTAVYSEAPRTCTITWITKTQNENGELVDVRTSKDFANGASLDGEFPAVTQTFYTDANVYTFTDWSPEPHAVNGDETYTAVYSSEPRMYEVTFKYLYTDEDGSTTNVYESTFGGSYEYGANLPNPGDAKSFQTLDKVYTFAGWSPELSDTVTSNQTYVAQYTVTPRKYKITWNDDKGVAYDTTEVAYGDTPTHSDPTKESTLEKAYKFIGWTPEIVPVVGDAVYAAVFEEKTREYEITWIYLDQNEDGTVEEKTEKFILEYGDAIMAPIVKSSMTTVDKIYTLTGWSTEVSQTVTGDQVFKAQYKIEPRMYAITWVITVQKEDGTLEEVEATKAFPYGAGLEGEFPEVELVFYTDKEVYNFKQWSPEPHAVTGDQVYVAEYQSEPREYAITWKDDVGEIIDVTIVAYGQTPTHVDPTKPATSQYTYTFAGWTPEVVPVTGEATYTATFTATAIPAPAPAAPPLTPEERSAKMNAKFKVYFGETPTDKVPALVVEWGRANGIASFEIFVQYLDEEAPTEPTLTLSSNGAAAYFDKLNGEVIDPSRSYVVYVVAKNRKGEEVGRTVTAFVAGPDNPDYTNPATITVTSGNSIALEKGQSFNIQAVVTLEDGTKGQIPGEYVPEFRYVSNKEKVATVSASGEIVAVGRGTCIIQVFAKNALVAEIKVAVK